LRIGDTAPDFEAETSEGPIRFHGRRGQDWRALATSATEAVSSIRPGDRVFVGTACATPRTLVDALERLDKPPAGVVLTHYLTDRVGSSGTHYRHRVFYVGRDIRGMRAHEGLEYLPLSLPDVPALLTSGRMPVDVALIQVAPPDADGLCSLGISVDVTSAAALAARRVIAEVNPAMPRTRGHGGIPIDRIDRLVSVDRPLAEYVHEPADGVADRIAAYVARLIDDGSTLQVGVGRVANQMLAHLTDRRDLAIHSDVITEPVVDLVAAGVISGPVVTSWAMGTRRLYDLVDDDERFAFQPIERVCDPAVIAAQRRMVSVTQGFAVDLGGQVCTESLDGEPYGGVSTGPAFHRGALASQGGKAIVCLASRTPAGEPAIRPQLDAGEAVAIARGDVHWVVTEYGIAYLFGRSLSERAVDLIEIAHPDDRADLLAAALEQGLVGPRQQLRRRAAYPVSEERDVRLRDGREVRIRPTRTRDFRALQELFYRMPQEDVQTRFFHALTELTDVAAQDLCSVDYERDMAFAAVVGPPEHERVVATSCYLADSRGFAEVAYMVDPEWQGAGLASRLHARMVEYARERNVRGFTAEVLRDNAAMLRVLQRGDHDTRVRTSDGIHEVRMLLASEPAG
jgi:acyl-CoA hydrolase/RimJ/RimL family protein N-acetyltransferase